MSSTKPSKSALLISQLSAVKSFDDNQRGERPDGGLSPNYKTYKALLNFRPPIGRSTYASLIEHGSPAAKLYAAMLINAQNAAAGKEALKELSSDKSPVTFVSGCEAMRVTVAEVARDFLVSGQYMHFQLPKP